jgi:hypothetical protein
MRPRAVRVLRDRPICSRTESLQREERTLPRKTRGPEEKCSAARRYPACRPLGDGLPEGTLRLTLFEGFPKLLEAARFVREQWISLALVFVLAAAGYAMDEHKAEVAPFLIDWESQALNVMTWADPRVRRADHVTVVEIDDATYRARKQGDRTDRRLLAALVRDAVRANAAVVALDIDLVRDSDDATLRAAANADLLNAMRASTRRAPAVPVVLAAALAPDGDGAWSEVPNVFADAQLPVADRNPDLPARAPVGFVNAPLDRRQLPLVFDAKPASGGAPEPFWSLGLRTADAYDSALDVAPTASQVGPVRDAIANGEFVYGTFLPAAAFLHVSANDLLNGTAAARGAQSSHRADRRRPPRRVRRLGRRARYAARTDERGLHPRQPHRSDSRRSHEASGAVVGALGRGPVPRNRDGRDERPRADIDRPARAGRIIRNSVRGRVLRLREPAVFDRLRTAAVRADVASAAREVPGVRASSRARETGGRCGVASRGSA